MDGIDPISEAISKVTAQLTNLLPGSLSAGDVTDALISALDGITGDPIVLEFYSENGVQMARQMMLQDGLTRLFRRSKEGRWAYEVKGVYVGKGSKIEKELNMQYESYLAQLTVSE